MAEREEKKRVLKTTDPRDSRLLSWNIPFPKQPKKSSKSVTPPHRTPHRTPQCTPSGTPSVHLTPRTQPGSGTKSIERMSSWVDETEAFGKAALAASRMSEDSGSNIFKTSSIDSDEIIDRKNTTANTSGLFNITSDTKAISPSSTKKSGRIDLDLSLIDHHRKRSNLTVDTGGVRTPIEARSPASRDFIRQPLVPEAETPLTTPSSTSAAQRGEIETPVSANSVLPRESSNQRNEDRERRVRLWCYLFDNLQRATDEIFYWCEWENSIRQCHEVLRVLKLTAGDIEKLIDQITIEREANEKAAAASRGVSWEVVVRNSRPASRPASSHDRPPSRSSSVRASARRSRSQRSAVISRRVVEKPLSQPLKELKAREKKFGFENLPPPTSSQATNTTRKKPIVEISAPNSPLQDGSTSESSPISFHPPRVRNLQAKLTSPERRKKTAEEMKQMLERRHFLAEKRRKQLDSKREQKLKKAAKRGQSINAWQDADRTRRILRSTKRLEKAEQLRKQQIDLRVSRASNENQKVGEIQFINSLTRVGKDQDMKNELEQRLTEGERRKKEWLRIIEEKARFTSDRAEAAAFRRKAMDDASRKRREVIKRRKMKVTRASDRNTKRSTAFKKTLSSSQSDISVEIASSTSKNEQGNTNSKSVSTQTKASEEDAKSVQRARSTPIMSLPSARAATTSSNVKTAKKTSNQGGGIDKGSDTGGDRKTVSANTIMSPLASLKHIQDRTKTIINAYSLKRKKKKARKLKKLIAKNTESHEKQRDKLWTDVKLHSESTIKNKIDALATFVNKLESKGEEKVMASPQDAVQLKAMINDIIVLMPKSHNKMQKTPKEQLFLMMEILLPRFLCRCKDGAEEFFLATVSESVLNIVQICCDSVDVVRYLADNNKIVPLIDIVTFHLGSKTDSPINLPKAFLILAILFKTLRIDSERIGDLLRYVGLCGLLHQTSSFFAQIRTALPHEKLPHEKLPCYNNKFKSELRPGLDAGIAQIPAAHLDLFMGVLQFLESFTTTARKRAPDINEMLDKKNIHGKTQSILEVLKETGIGGIMPLMAYLSIRPPTARGSKNTYEYPDVVIALLSSSLCVLNNVARLHIHALQEFGSEYQMEILHLLRILLPYTIDHTGNKSVDSLLEQLLLFVGYFTLQNKENQDLLRWGKVPTLMQHLCNLPFSFFSNPEQKELLFPTLLCATYDNKANKELMLREINGKLLVSYLKSKGDKKEGKRAKRSSNFHRISSRFPSALWSEASEFYK